MKSKIKLLLKEIIDDKNISLIKNNDKQVFDNIIELSNIILKDKTSNKHNEVINILNERVSSEGRKFIINILSWREENMIGGESYICDFSKFTNPKDFVESYWYIYENECEGETWNFDENNFIDEFITNFKRNEEEEAELEKKENEARILRNKKHIAKKELELTKEKSRAEEFYLLAKENKKEAIKKVFNNFEESFNETDNKLKWTFTIKSGGDDSQLHFKIYLSSDLDLLNIKNGMLIDSFKIKLDDIEAFSVELGCDIDSIESNPIIKRMMNVTSINWSYPNRNFFNRKFIKFIKAINGEGDKNE